MRRAVVLFRLLDNDVTTGEFHHQSDIRPMPVLLEM
jgi:hypothetical protein